MFLLLSEKRHSHFSVSNLYFKEVGKVIYSTVKVVVMKCHFVFTGWYAKKSKGGKRWKKVEKAILNAHATKMVKFTGSKISNFLLNWGTSVLLKFLDYNPSLSKFERNK